MITSGLTVLQPFASAIAAGVKLVENRPWRRKVPDGGLWVGLHAGGSFYDGAPDIRARWKHSGMWADVPPLEQMPRGVLLGAMCVKSIEPYTDSMFFDNPLAGDPWAFGPWCWMIDRVILLDEPVTCRGMQGLWPLTEDHRELLSALL